MSAYDAAISETVNASLALPRALLEDSRTLARSKGQSLSEFVAELLTAEVAPPTRRRAPR